MQTELYTIFQTLGISLLLGLLVGMQREQESTRIAGFRTFAIVTLLGTARRPGYEGHYVVRAHYLHNIAHSA